MLEYAVKLTRDPGGMTAADVEALRRAGFDDPGILDICQVTAYYAYVNRLADGLGVELEQHWRPEDLVLSRAEFDAIRAERRTARGSRLAGPAAHDRASHWTGTGPTTP